MAESSPSFQEILKLMSSMTAFETLLNAADLNLETCIKLGIHEQFKNLHEKIGKYVHYDDTKGLNLKCICNLCNEEIKIFNSDLKSSLAIHNRSELHKIIVKNKEMNQHSKDLSSDFKKKHVQTQMDRNNVLVNEKFLSKDNDIGQKVNNLSRSKVQQACTCQTPFCICGYGSTGLTHLGGKLSNLNLSQQDIQYLLPTGSIQGVSGIQPKTRGRTPPKVKLAKGNNSSSTPNLTMPSSQQSINIHLHMATSKSPTPDPKRSASKPRPHSPNSKLITSVNLEKLRLRELEDRAEIQLMFKMVKEAEGVLWKRENITKDGDEFNCNICGNHMGNPYDLVKHTLGKNHKEKLSESHSKPRHHSSNPLTEKNMEKVRNRDLDEKAEMALMWRMVKQAEGRNWKRSNITKVSEDEFCCNLCNIDLNSPYQLLQHVKGKGHQSELDN